LPRWLGGSDEILADATSYFAIGMASIPFLGMSYLGNGMLQCSGNMRLPARINIMTCVLDVVFNSLFIFPTRLVGIGALQLTVPGLGLGVAGAALGTATATAIAAVVAMWSVLRRSDILGIRRGDRLRFEQDVITNAIRISAPVAFENMVMSGALVITTRIVAPLGSVAIAANSFSVTAEGLCYMPGYGIGAAATTLVGQSIGARRKWLSRRLAWLTTGLGVAIMTLMACLMYVFAPQMIGLLTPDPAIRELGATVLRIEAFAEPMYAASIVASGALRGAGDTLVPFLLNFGSLWLVRIPLSAYLAPIAGLRGVWVAMCIELNVRGVLLLLRLRTKGWSRRAIREE
ncbi:MAG: MATE family efflux transporter, partial [Atopobiaceae bacterium]|nr:MATE family efflux transporter [Atopobiaceae bacterium]